MSFLRRQESHDEILNQVQDKMSGAASEGKTVKNTIQG